MQLVLRLDGRVDLLSGVWEDLEQDPEMVQLNAAWSAMVPTEGLIAQWKQPDNRMVAAVWSAPGTVSADWTEKGAAVPSRPALGSARVLMHDVADPVALQANLGVRVWERLGIMVADWGYGRGRFEFDTILVMILDASFPIQPFQFPKP